VQKYVVEKGHLLLTKPFTMQQLEKKVAEALKPRKLTKSNTHTS